MARQARHARSSLISKQQTLFIRIPGRRLGTEYRNYNGAPVELRREIAARGIRDAVVFFEDEVPFACYTPFNDLDGGGDVVFARHRGVLADYRLLARFPGKRSFLTRAGRDLVERPNFYREDIDRLARDVERLGAERATNVVPWRSVAPSPLLDALPGTTRDVSAFLDGLTADPGSADTPRLVALAGSAAPLAPVLDGLLVTTTPGGVGAFEGPLALRWLAGPRGGRFERLPGIHMTCYANATWTGPPTARQVVAGFDADLCPGENRSITFETRLEVARERQFRLSLDSDDGSGLWIDGHLGDKMKFERSDTEFQAGYLIRDPYNDLTVGFFVAYKTIDAPASYTNGAAGLNDADIGTWKLSGPGLGVLAEKHLDTSTTLSGSLAYLYLQQEFSFSSGGVSRFDSGGWSFEVALAHAFSKRISADVGVKYQRFKGDMLNGNDVTDSFSGLTAGVAYTF